MPMHRRKFMYTTAWGGVIGMAAPRLFAENTKETQAPILVVIQLAGGNDGLNTVVPIRNDDYYKARPKLAIKPADALKLDDDTGLHPDLSGWKALYDEGQLAIVEGVGYPNPNRSHFRSTEIWHTASDSDITEKYGWLGRYFDTYGANARASIGLCIGRQNPQAFNAAMPKGVTFDDPRRLQVQKAKGMEEEMMMQMMGMEEEEIAEPSSGDSIGDLSGTPAGHTAGLNPLDFLENTAVEANVSSQQIQTILAQIKPKTTFPNSRFAKELQVVSQLIQGGMPTQIYYLSRGGFDTHTNQVTSHAALMKDIAGSLQAFQNELKASNNHNRTATFVYSEFGRRVKENASGGTDHGVAAPVFVMGGTIKGGRHGKAPNLEPDKLIKGDLAHTVDYRSVYATLLEKHLGVDSQPILLKKFEPLGFI